MINPLTSTSMLLSLDSPDAVLENAGGKGANLSRLLRAGLPVPPGFILTTHAYHAYVEAEQLELRILALLEGAYLEEPDSLEQASEQIRALFTGGLLPVDIVNALRQAYRALESPPVAVRSSATAEDLPEMSFAGQQDTYLNVIGEDELLKAVMRCWGSLWTARAIGYRMRNHVPQEGIALAVVVQQMIPSEASGVLFTANPLTGLRDEVVIDATIGLGEALVSGQVEPDHYIVHPAGRQITEKRLGAKRIAIRGQPSGGVITTQEEAAGLQALPEDAIIPLAEMGKRVEALLGAPQDIEWGWAGGKIYLLQSRPITSLFPVPEGDDSNGLHVMFSFGAVQGMLDPVTPLGADLIRLLFAGGADLFGYHHDQETQKVIRQAGQRLWIDITPVLRNSVGRKMARYAFNMVEPAVGQSLDRVWTDPRLVPTRRGIRPAALLRIARFALPTLGRMVMNWARPVSRADRFQQMTDEAVQQYQADISNAGSTPEERLARRLALARELYFSFPKLGPHLLSSVASGMAAFNWLYQIARHIPANTPGLVGDPEDLVLEATRGLSNNVTTTMDLRLWQAARSIRQSPEALFLFKSLNPSDLAKAFTAEKLPPAVQEPLAQFMRQYGLRGLAEIDAGRERWVEDPAHIMAVLHSYIQIKDEAQAPDVVFARSACGAKEAVDRLAQAARHTRLGWLKARLIRFSARRMRALMGLRESPKFYMVRLFGSLRLGLLESGREMVAAGRLARHDDLFFLSLNQLRDFTARQPGEWQEIIDRNRADYQREMRRRQIPRLLLSDGRAFYEGLAAEAGSDGLSGSPVSPGVNEGCVRVVLDPRGAHLSPGEILVCPGTDPSWTPLFLTAGGLVMEVGGMMTHGAVVAREYGIPAVVGVHQATTRLKTGQRVRVNGSTGTIVLLD